MVTYIRSDLEFILQQILIAEQHAAGADLTTLVPNSFVPFGLRTVDGSFNNLFPGNEEFGAADNLFPRLTDPVFRDAGGDDRPGRSCPDRPSRTPTYGQSGFVVDSEPRIISNLIVDQTSNNPAAVAVAGSAGADGLWGTADDALNDGVAIIGRGRPGRLAGTADDIAEFSFDNVAPDEGLSAPFNLWFVFFGQFFDHGLDLLARRAATARSSFRCSPTIRSSPGGWCLRYRRRSAARLLHGADAGHEPLPGPATDGARRRRADDIHEHMNKTSPFVDQNQTYTSTPSHQVFLREYEFNADGDPVATGKLITNRDLVRWRVRQRQRRRPRRHVDLGAW